MFRKLALAALLAAPARRRRRSSRPAAALAPGLPVVEGGARRRSQNGQAVSLSKMVKRIQKATGGEILPTPELCKNGGRLVYLGQGAQARRLGARR